MPAWIWSYADGKDYRVRNQHLRAAIALNSNQELPSCLGERKKINNAKQAQFGMPFESTDASIEKASQSMGKANESLSRVPQERITER